MPRQLCCIKTRLESCDAGINCFGGNLLRAVWFKQQACSPGFDPEQIMRGFSVWLDAIIRQITSGAAIVPIYPLGNTLPPTALIRQSTWLTFSLRLSKAQAELRPAAHHIEIP
jgi:hypothetical protein